MGKLIAQRLGLAVITLAAFSVLIFAGTEILPGDLASAILANNATPENLAALRHQLHLDLPAYVRFWNWASSVVFHADFGTSLASGQPVLDEIIPRLRNTMFLALAAAIVSVPLSVVLGLTAAIKQGSVYDRLVNVVTLMTISVPEYFMGYILITIFAMQLGWFSPISNVTPEMPFFERIWYTILPMTTLVLVVVAHMMRMTRASVLAIMASPYIEMAILKGIPKWRIVVQHALPNALAPIISVIAINLAYLITGVVLAEVVFVYPGLGQFMVDSVSKRDMPMVQGCGLIFAAAYILLNMIADILAIMTNPRLRHPR